MHPLRAKWIQPSSLLLREVFSFHHWKEWFESNHSISQRLKCQKAENRSSEWWNLSVLLTRHLHTASVLTDGWMVCTWYGCFFMVFPPHVLKNGLFGTHSTGVHRVSKLHSNCCLQWQGFLVCTISIALYYSENKMSVKGSRSPCGHPGTIRWVGTIVHFSCTLLLGISPFVLPASTSNASLR